MSTEETITKIECIRKIRLKRDIERRRVKISQTRNRIGTYEKVIDEFPEEKEFWEKKIETAEIEIELEKEKIIEIQKLLSE